jgi:hypothetical protein
VKTGKENALCTFTKLSSLVNATMKEQGHAMDKLGIPQFTADLLSQVSDFHHNTPGSGLMTLNAHFWGKSRGDIEAAQLAVVRRFSNRADTMIIDYDYCYELLEKKDIIILLRDGKIYYPFVEVIKTDKDNKNIDIIKIFSNNKKLYQV